MALLLPSVILSVCFLLVESGTHASKSAGVSSPGSVHVDFVRSVEANVAEDHPELKRPVRQNSQISGYNYKPPQQSFTPGNQQSPGSNSGISSQDFQNNFNGNFNNRPFFPPRSTSILVNDINLSCTCQCYPVQGITPIAGGVGGGCAGNGQC
ncbi:uncharacterized protein [Periplaneta americana]|uniref:uncharacterized protein n=1 Tax=Periplaneta americana TaxID=6978 RepID=UPI0037E8B753